MNSKVCIAVPIKAITTDLNRPLLEQVVQAQPDFIELRFDYIQDFNRITSSFLEHLLSFTTIPVIFTLRSHIEGGHIKLDDTERRALFRKFIEANPSYIDIEINSPNTLLQEIVPLCISKQIKIICSYHNFTLTESLHEAQQIIDDYRNKMQNILQDDALILKSFIFKLIFTATQFEDNLIPLKICRQFNSQGYKIISFCMGELGIFSRIICLNAGSFFTYAALEDTTAPGQLNINMMRQLFSFL
jgi:3-dehydroquinate dehydratase type I